MKTKILVFCFVLLLAWPVLAQENATVEAVDIDQGADLTELQVDETVSPEDLGVKEPVLLPDNPFFFLKRAWEGTGNFFTFDPVKKADRLMNQASMRLLEAKKLAEKNGNDQVVEKAMEQYGKKVEAIKNRVAKFKDKNQEKVNRFLDKFAENQFRHQRILDKVEKLTPKQKEKIKNIKQQVLENAGLTLASVDLEKLQARLEKAMTNVNGSELKNLKNLEILKNLEEKVPEKAKVAIRRAQENALKRLSAGIKNIDAKDRTDKIKRYLDNLGVDDIDRADIVDRLENISDLPRDLKTNLFGIKKQFLDQIKDKVEQVENDNSVGAQTELKRLQRRLDDMVEIKNQLSPRVLRKINEIKTEVKKNVSDDQENDDKNISSDDEINDNESDNELNNELDDNKLGKLKACPQVWDPVCGVDGKTYDNRCFSLANGVKVKHQGRCLKNAVNALGN